MNDGMLSQDEIDALLNISTENDKNHEAEPSIHLSDIEIDTIGEIGNISFGSSATALSTLLNQKVEITTPSVSIIEKDELAGELTFQPVSIQVDYTKGFSGRNVLVIKARDAAIIADIMLGGDGTNPDESLPEIYLSAVQEAMNQMMGTAATSMSTVFNKTVDISPPTIIEGTIESDAKEIFQEDVYVKVFFRLIVGDLIDSNMMQLIPLSFAKELVNQLLDTGDSEPIDIPVQEETAATTIVENPVKIPDRSIESNEQVDSTFMDRESFDDRVDNKRNQPQFLGNTYNQQDASIEQATFAEFEPTQLSSNEQSNLNMLLDIPLKVTVELGRTKKTIKDILDLSQGSIVELDKLAGEPVDILVNGKLIAEGEVVVIEENFGVRVTDIISQSDRIMKLK
ncbi:flagellar motor switch phosphatase FliY [Oceanobacillus luteolus]|uniref:Flagellar motor switch phosphatase FliY n=1 Tax=Oceanobacillus luteolus TaxID=1274358 RepID=A0ABW4HSL5_9BACI|nr:flagellar motor switch phosphatase FliY [Oceanobacillus luteolus]MCM3739037.1 flagellar motor switch phosphatase FliY [Oceanobacillus luteolus]